MSETETRVRHCHDCKWCGMDMDMDPYCAQPKVLATYPYGLVLHSMAIVRFCRAPEHPLFEARLAKDRF